MNGPSLMQRTKNGAVLILTAIFVLIVSHSAQAQDWMTLEEAQERARNEGKTIFVFVEADWCGFCKRMKQDIFPRDEIHGLLESHYLLVRIDLDSRDNVIFNEVEFTERSFARQMEVLATPTIIFIGPTGEILGRQHGFISAERLHALLRYVVSDQFGEISFDTFVEGNF